MKVKSETEVAQSCPTFSDPKDCSLPGSSIHRIFQARVLEWGAIASLNIYTTIRKIDIQWELSVSLRELKPWLCNNLEGCDGGGGKESRRRGHMDIYG